MSESCKPEFVSGWVDGSLDDEAAAALERHAATCTACSEQADAERALRVRLRELPLPELPFGFESRLRRSLRPPRALWLVAAVPLAAALLVAVWARGAAPIVALALAFDHDKCFAHDPLPAKLWTDDPGVAADWFEASGTRLPVVPAAAANTELVGARYCPLFTLTRAPHLYYASDESQVSIFVVPHSVRLPQRVATYVHRGRTVQLLRVMNTTLGIVAKDAETASAFRQRFEVMVASRD